MTKEKVTISERQRKAFSAIGRMGGLANYNKRGSAYMSKIGKKGAKVKKALREKQ